MMNKHEKERNEDFLIRKLINTMPMQSDRLRSTSTRRINSFREYVIFGGMSEVSSLSYDDFVHQVYQIQSTYLIQSLLINIRN
jgi:hypothetical protein